MRKNKKWKYFGTAVVITAAVILLYPLLTDIYSYYEQTRLVEQQPESGQSLSPVQGTDGAGAEDDSARVKATSAPIHAWGYLNIPSLKVKTAVVEGTTPNMLAIAPGWYPESALPGQGNTAIAGHLNCYGSYFRRLYTLGAGDKIFLTYEDKIYCYEVESVTTIDSVSNIIFPCGYNALTLTTCTTEDKNSRTAVRARLVSIDGADIGKS